MIYEELFAPQYLYYDKTIDRFCGIDMAASFSSPLALFACRQLEGIKRSQFPPDELFALASYEHTLEFLLKNWSPEKQERMLLESNEMAGFKKGGFLFDQNVADRIDFYNNCIKDNYKNCIKLVKLQPDFLSITLQY